MAELLRLIQRVTRFSPSYFEKLFLSEDPFIVIKRFIPVGLRSIYSILTQLSIIEIITTKLMTGLMMTWC